jgi:hypothetical protein
MRHAFAVSVSAGLHHGRDWRIDHLGSVKIEWDFRARFSVYEPFLNDYSVDFQAPSGFRPQVAPGVGNAKKTS